ncbi:MAG: Fibronectin/fibrinogen-binding protein [Myxococcaceae bacterium]|nr:Fibronectin/fibrinogen-binding protein [Myxococcaceae bacterium]
MRVQRVDGPARDCLSLTFFERGEKFSLVLLFGQAVRGIGARHERPKGEPASSFIQRLRTQIEGARLDRAEWLDGKADQRSGHAQALLLHFVRAEHRARIAIDFDAQAPNLFLLRDDDTIAGASDERARRQRFASNDAAFTTGAGRGIAIIETADALFEAGETLLQSSEEKREDNARSRAQAKARAALKKVQRKVDAIRGDLARAAAAPRLRREAQLLLCNLGTIPRGATMARLLDEMVDPPEWVEVALDPAHGAQQLAQQRFERARKVERGVAIASARLHEAEREAAELNDLLVRLEHEPLEALTTLAEARGVGLTPTRSGKPKPQQRVPYRVFIAASGEKILVGKGAADNDTLTLTVARPHDHWLHVRGVSGSHVVVPLERKVVIAQELLLDAAHLAAHFSKQRGEPTVEIAHTERRFVRKPKGAAAGSVNVDRERVFVLRFERERLARLLASERS